MAKFTDCLGRSWELRITTGLLPKLRAVGFDVGAAVKGADGLLPLADPERLGQVLWVLCEPQSLSRNITAEEFASGFDGGAIEDATTAMLETIADFTQPRNVAAVMKKAIPGAKAKTEAEAIRKIETLFGSTDSAGASAGSPESTPAT